MSRIAYALAGRDACNGSCETRAGCDCLRPHDAKPAAPTVQRQTAPVVIPTRRGWFDRWVNGMRVAYLRKLIDIGETRQLQLEAEMRANEADIANLRVQLALVEH